MNEELLALSDTDTGSIDPEEMVGPIGVGLASESGGSVAIGESMVEEKPCTD